MFFLIIFSYDLHGFSKAMYTLTMYSLLHCLESTAVHLVLLLTSGVFLFFFLATLQDFSSSTRAWTWATTVKSGMLTTRPPGNSLEIFNSVLFIFIFIYHTAIHMCVYGISHCRHWTWLSLRPERQHNWSQKFQRKVDKLYVKFSKHLPLDDLHMISTH